MKYILIFVFVLFCGLSVGSLKNMHKYGYGVNDAFWRVVWAIDEGTIWAENFSEEKFKKVKVGMTMEQVVSLLGQPLNSSERCENGCSWSYTKQDSGSSDYDQRRIFFDKNRLVIEVRKTFFID